MFSGNASSGGSGFSLSFTTIGPDGRRHTRRYGGAAREDEDLPFPFFGSGPGSAPHYANLLNPGVRPSNPFSAMLQEALLETMMAHQASVRAGGPGIGILQPFGGAGAGQPIDQIAAQLFAQQQAPSERPTAASVIEGLPKLTVTEEDVKEKKSCSVCMSDFAVGETDVVKLPCTGAHMFHFDCLTPWLKEHNTCPVCRYELKTQTQEEEERSRAGSAGRRRRRWSLTGRHRSSDAAAAAGSGAPGPGPADEDGDSSASADSDGAGGGGGGFLHQIGGYLASLFGLGSHGASRDGAGGADGGGGGAASSSSSTSTAAAAVAAGQASGPDGGGGASSARMPMAPPLSSRLQQPAPFPSYMPDGTLDTDVAHAGGGGRVMNDDEEQDADLQAAIRASLAGSPQPPSQAQAQQASAAAATSLGGADGSSRSRLMAEQERQYAQAMERDARMDAASGQGSAADGGGGGGADVAVVDDDEAMEPEVRQAILDSLHSLSLPQLRDACKREGVAVDAAQANDSGHLIRLLAGKQGIRLGDPALFRPPSHASASTTTSSPTAASSAPSSLPSSSQHVPSAPIAGVPRSSTPPQPFASVVRIPPEPNTDDPDAFHVRIRLPDGSSLTRRFDMRDTVGQIAAWIVAQPGKSGLFTQERDGTPRMRIRDPAPLASAASSAGSGDAGGTTVQRGNAFDPSNWSLELEQTGFSKRAALIAEPF